MAKRNSKKHKKGETYKKRVLPDGKTMGTLRRGWTVGEVRKEGGIYHVEVVNNTYYAPFAVKSPHPAQIKPTFQTIPT